MIFIMLREQDIMVIYLILCQILI